MTAAFLRAVAGGDILKMREMLKADATLARARDANGLSAVMTACYRKQSVVVDALLEYGFELDMFEAATTGGTERVRALLEIDKSSANAFASDGFTPLGLAAFFGHRDVVQALLEAGAAVNVASQDFMKVTPLQSAVAAREVEIARLLIAHGANVNVVQPAGGFTPLHEAALKGDLEIATLLLEHRASVNAKLPNGKTPLALALAHKHGELAAFLREHGGME